MPRRSENILDILISLPWWCSLLTACITYVGMVFVLPHFQSDSLISQGIVIGAQRLAPFVALFFLLPIPFSLFNAQRKKNQLDEQRDIESIQNLSWRQFEELVGEAYRRQGYRVIENDSKGPDGGIDLVIGRDGKNYLVQCKQWRNQKIGVKVVREMFGLVTAEQAAGGIVISSGAFTKEAVVFASGKPLELVDGAVLVEMVGNVQRKPNLSRMAKAEVHEPSTSTPSAPLCAACGKEMILRTAQKGPKAGQKFWGCSGFPKCRETTPYNS